MLTKIRKKSALLDKTCSLAFEHERFGEKMRYLFVGGLCAVGDLVFLYFLVDFLHVWYLLAAAISFITITSLGYSGQKYFTFQNSSKNHKKQLPVFFVVTGTGLAINMFCMYLFVSIFGLWYILGSVITKFIVLIWNFSANKYITFRQ